MRTLQYYDRIALLCPSARTEGGRRLYTSRDLVLLHQIISLKSLGFSLEDIKLRLPALETPAQVAEALCEQASALQRQIGQLSDALTAIEQLKAEVLQMQAVDFEKYADIISNLQMKNDQYYLIKYFDPEILEHIHTHFIDKKQAADFISRIRQLQGQLLQLQKDRLPPESPQCQQLAAAYWGLITEFTGGDMGLVAKLMAASSASTRTGELQKKQGALNGYLQAAFQHYFQGHDVDPFKGVEG